VYFCKLMFLTSMTNTIINILTKRVVNSWNSLPSNLSFLSKYSVGLFTAYLLSYTVSQKHIPAVFWPLCILQLKCCGAVGPQDYYYSLWYNHTHHTMGSFVPDSCCPSLKQAKQADSQFKGDTECQIVAIDMIVNPTTDNNQHASLVRHLWSNTWRVQKARWVGQVGHGPPMNRLTQDQIANSLRQY